MHVRTKIVCTIGPAVETLERMIALVEAGMNVARINFSHGTHEEHAETIARLKEARRQTTLPLAIMLDTKGPEIRVGKITGGSRRLKPGQVLSLSGSGEGDESIIPITPPSVLSGLSKGTRILFDDGYIGARIIEILEDRVLIEVMNEGELRSGKGINIPDCPLNLPMITEQDRRDLIFGCQQGVDLVAASFVCNSDHILEMKHLLADEGSSHLMVFAKIETAQGVEHIDSILKAADGIMVARGDLGVELPLSRVPMLQKMLIRKCYEYGKPSITATQMLESMIHNPRPTRAEASDVANAIYDSTGAVMLSGETAVGAFPIETVKTMQKIAYETEQDFPFETFMQEGGDPFHDVRSAVAYATVRTAYSTEARAIFAMTSTGRAARLISRLRPSVPIVAMTFSEIVYHQLAAIWGVIPVMGVECYTTEEAFKQLTHWALEEKIVAFGDVVVVATGVPFGITGTTNTMIVESIGDVAARGHEGMGQRVSGEVFVIYSLQDLDPALIRGKILIMNRCDEDYLPFLEQAAGALLDNQADDVASERYLLSAGGILEIPVIVGVNFSQSPLESGQPVTLDPSTGVVYRGVRGPS